MELFKDCHEVQGMTPTGVGNPLIFLLAPNVNQMLLLSCQIPQYLLGGLTQNSEEMHAK